MQYTCIYNYYQARCKGKKIPTLCKTVDPLRYENIRNFLFNSLDEIKCILLKRDSGGFMWPQNYWVVAFVMLLVTSSVAECNPIPMQFWPAACKLHLEFHLGTISSPHTFALALACWDDGGDHQRKKPAIHDMASWWSCWTFFPMLSHAFASCWCIFYRCLQLLLPLLDCSS